MRRVGFLLPSSNCIVEPALAWATGGSPVFSFHTARVSVTDVNLSAAAERQFAPDPMQAAASLLVDVGPDMLCWCGTSGGWLGLDHDRALVAGLEQRFGIPATTATLATLGALAALGATRIGLLTPFLPEVHAAVCRTFAGAGLTVAAEQSFGVESSRAMAEIPPESVSGALASLSGAGPDALVTFCTNLDAWKVGVGVEAGEGPPVVDSVAASLWATASGGITDALLGLLFSGRV
jgi:maleate isomerase